jgi:hypothetical protein
VDRHAHAASCMNYGIGDDFTDQQNRQHDYRRLLAY